MEKLSELLEVKFLEQYLDLEWNVCECHKWLKNTHALT